MKNLLYVAVFSLSIPWMCESQTVAYSPSIPWQPLIFHFNSMYLSQFSAVTWTQLQNALLIRSSYTHYLDDLVDRDCCSGPHFWVDGMGRWLHQNTETQEQFGYNDITGGVTLGADICCNNFLFGAAASYTNSNLRWEETAGDSQINSYYGGLYGSWNEGCFYLNGSLLGAFSDYHTSRHIKTGSLFRHAYSSHESWEILTGIEAGLTFEELCCTIDLIPFVSVDYVYLSQDGREEHGARGINLNLHRRDDQLIQSEIGLQLTRPFLYECCSTSWIFAPNVSLSYVNQTSLSGSSYYSNFTSRSNVYHFKGWNFEHNLGEVDLSLNFFDCTETIKFSLYYDGQFGKNYWNQAGGILCNVTF